MGGYGAHLELAFLQAAIEHQVVLVHRDHVGPRIGIEVAEHRSRRGSGLQVLLAKRAIAVVAVDPVAGGRAEEEIEVAVVIEVGKEGRPSAGAVADSGRARESARAVVTEQRASRIDVEIAVIVVVAAGDRPVAHGELRVERRWNRDFGKAQRIHDGLRISLLERQARTERQHGVSRRRARWPTQFRHPRLIDRRRFQERLGASEFYARVSRPVGLDLGHGGRVEPLCLARDLRQPLPQELELVPRLGRGARVEEGGGEGEPRRHVGRRGLDQPREVLPAPFAAVGLRERVQRLQMRRCGLEHRFKHTARFSGSTGQSQHSCLQEPDTRVFGG